MSSEEIKNEESLIGDAPAVEPVEPNPEDIRRRFFEDRAAASKFAQSMQEEGYRTRIRTDGI